MKMFIGTIDELAAHLLNDPFGEEPTHRVEPGPKSIREVAEELANGARHGGIRQRLSERLHEIADGVEEAQDKEERRGPHIGRTKSKLDQMRKTLLNPDLGTAPSDWARHVILGYHDFDQATAAKGLKFDQLSYDRATVALECYKEQILREATDLSARTVNEAVKAFAPPVGDGGSPKRKDFEYAGAHTGRFKAGEKVTPAKEEQPHEFLKRLGMDGMAWAKQFAEVIAKEEGWQHDVQATIAEHALGYFCNCIEYVKHQSETKGENRGIIKGREEGYGLGRKASSEFLRLALLDAKLLGKNASVSHED